MFFQTANEIIETKKRINTVDKQLNAIKVITEEIIKKGIGVMSFRAN